MSTKTEDRDITPWIVKTDEAPEPGYDEALREDIAVGERQLGGGHFGRAGLERTRH